MSKFKTFCESILEEAKIDDEIDKAGLSDDQSAKAQELYNQIGKKAKFAKFICVNIETKEDLVKMMNEFETNLTRLDDKDINHYTIDSLKEKLKGLGISKTKQKQEISKDAPIVWESKDGTIVIRNILTWEASKKYGAGTKWCITNKDDAYHWNNYTLNNGFNFYFVEFLSRKVTDPMYKLAIVINQSGSILSIYNTPDNNILHQGLDELKDRDIPLDIFKKIDLSNLSTEELLQKIGTHSPLKINADGSVDIDYKGVYELPRIFVKDGKLRFKINTITHGMRVVGIGLTTLEGFPEVINGYFNVSNNELKTLEGCPKKIKGDFHSNNMASLTSLIGAPEEVSGMFLIMDCGLTDLKYCTQKVGSEVEVSKNKNLTSLEGCIQEVSNGYFSCSKCPKLTSLEGGPKKVSKNYYCYNCGKSFGEREVRELCKVGGEVRYYS